MVSFDTGIWHTHVIETYSLASALWMEVNSAANHSNYIRPGLVYLQYIERVQCDLFETRTLAFS